MIISCLVPVIIVLAFGLAAPPLSRKVRPRLAIWLLSAGGFVLTGCLVASVSVVAAIGAGQLAPFARLGHWSARAVGLYSPYRQWSIWMATLLLAVATARAAMALWGQSRRLRVAWSASQASPDRLVVLVDDHPFAYAVPGWPGRIVISRGLLRGLDGAGRRAVLAHEQTHLSERHDLHHLATAVATAVNPLLGRTAAALSLACERRADEVAARTVADRRVVAQAIATAACPQLDTLAWSATGSDVPLRVAALLIPARHDRMASAVVLAAVLAAVAASTASVLWLGHDLRNVLVAARY